jgi:hypothetical protein
MSFKEWLATSLGVKPQVVVEKEYVTEYKIVALKEPRTKEWDKETRDAVAALTAHPGFLAVVNRLATQRQMIQTKLSSGFHKELREVDYLQAGIFWLDYVQEQVNKATQVKLTARPTEAYDEELEAFKQIDAQLERVGME